MNANTSLPTNQDTQLKICTVTTVKAPLNDVKLFVNYHLNIGIDHIFLYFDDPEDQAIEIFINHEKITTVSCDGNHWQRLGVSIDPSIEERQIANANETLKTALDLNYQWIVHLDIDELIYPHTNLKQELQAVSGDIFAVRFKTLEAIPEKDQYDEVLREISFFKEIKPNWRYRKLIALLLGCGQAFKDGYFKAHIEGKTAVRTNANILSMNIHCPRLEDPSKVQELSTVRLLHYDSCEYATWYKKWMRRYDGTATAVQLGKPRAKQYQQFISALGKNELALKKLYASIYIIPKPMIFILRILGFVKKIKLDQSLFND